VSPRTVSAGLHRVEGLIEKPAPAEAPSNLAVIGRYVLPPEIFSILRKTQPGKNGEIQLTDALRELAKRSPMYALEIQDSDMMPGTSWDFSLRPSNSHLRTPLWDRNLATICGIGCGLPENAARHDRAKPSKPAG